MAITTPRYRVLPVRGTYAALLAEIDEINDNEICYAIDQDQYYQKEGAVLVQVGATKAQGAKADTAVQPVDLGPTAFSNSYLDLNDRPDAVEVGDNISLLANNIGYLTEAVANALYVKLTDGLGVLSDVDLATLAPAADDVLVYNGSDWVPGQAVPSGGDIIDGGNLDTGVALGGGIVVDGGVIT